MFQLNMQWVINKVGGLELLEGVVDVGFKIEKAK